jgi:glycosyltransferase involved in cell wall biosynthesis
VIHLPPQLAKLRVAIIHYWFVTYGGGERVVEALAELFPQADLFSLVVDKSALATSLQNRKIYTSFLQNIPWTRKHHRHFLLLQPLALEQFDLRSYDLVISSESGPAKGVITSPHTCSICYCHSPMRYLWDMSAEYPRSMGPIVRPIFTLASHYMRMWDYASAGRVDYFVANSQFVASRIRKYYRRESTVIHPPVNVTADDVQTSTGSYYLSVGRLVSYKRIDLAVEACSRMGRSLHIVGDGPEYRALKRIAGPSVQFLGVLSEHELQKQFANCRAFLLPGEEDFGIAPVEAQGYGRPVIAFGSGGALETVRGIWDSSSTLEEPTGIFFAEQSAASLMQAISRLEAGEHRFSPQAIRAHALHFDREHFTQKMMKFASDAVSQWREQRLQADELPVLAPILMRQRQAAAVAMTEKTLQ